MGVQQQADKRGCRRRKTVGDGVLVLGYPTVCVLNMHKNWMKINVQYIQNYKVCERNLNQFGKEPS